MKNVKDYGAKGDGLSDDRAAIQAALDASVEGEEIYVPEGRYMLSRSPTAMFAAIRVPPGRRLRGDVFTPPVDPGLRIRPTMVAATEDARACRLVHVDGPNVSIESLSLFGSDQGDPQRHGIYTVGARYLRLFDVDCRGFGGDGVYINYGSSDISVHRCVMRQNGRNGITFGGGTSGALIDGCQILENMAQGIDSEPPVSPSKLCVDGVSIRQSIIKSTSDYAITVSGCSADSQSKSWDISDCTIYGSVLFRWALARMSACTVSNMSLKPAVHIDRNTVVSITDNQLSCYQNTTDGNSVIWMAGTGPGNTPSARIANNRIASVGRALAYGIRCTAVDDVIIEDNVMSGPKMPSPAMCAGIYLRPTLSGVPFRRALIHRNIVSDWNGYGVRIGSGPVGSSIDRVSILENVFERTQDGPEGAMMAGMVLDDGIHAATDVVAAENVASGCPLYAVLPAGDPAAYGQRWTRSALP